VPTRKGFSPSFTSTGDKRMSDQRPYADPTHPGNRLRLRIVCVGCGNRGCITAWGPWCLDCNIERMDRISGTTDQIAERPEPRP
jgi:hypothetical protein